MLGLKLHRTNAFIDEFIDVKSSLISGAVSWLTLLWGGGCLSHDYKQIKCEKRFGFGFNSLKVCDDISTSHCRAVIPLTDSREP